LGLLAVGGGILAGLVVCGILGVLDAFRR